MLLLSDYVLWSPAMISFFNKAFSKLTCTTHFRNRNILRVQFMAYLEKGALGNFFPEIYSPPQSRCYDDYIGKIKSINKTLRKEGVLAPGEKAFENVKTLYHSIGETLDVIPVVHVGGTNGKGSTSHKVAQAFITNGFKTGLFVSPHIACFRERMQINNELISEEQFIVIYDEIAQKCIDLQIPATEFEMAFLMACLYFSSAQCDVVVLEVGVGGLHDATNVVNTAISVICSVSYDHMRFLGSTLEEICEKKAGIFKTHKPALIGPNVPHAVASLYADKVESIFYDFESASREHGQLLIDCGCSVQNWKTTDELNSIISLLVLAILKKHNNALFEKLNLSSNCTQSAIKSSPPFRWEKHEYRSQDSNGTVEVILDVGHNPAAIEAIGERLRLEYPGRTYKCIFAMSRDKDLHHCLRNVSKIFHPDNIFFVQSQYYRAVDTQDLKNLFYEETGVIIDISHTDKDALSTIRNVLNDSCDENASSDSSHVVVVCGTGYIMSFAHEVLGIIDPRDKY